MFVGILNSSSTLYFWDQFFLTKWDTVYIEYAIKSILYLLRDRFMSAADYDEMRKIFLDEPCLLHTADIQTAFIHLSLKNGDPKSIPNINRRFNPVKKQNIYLEIIGIKDISLSLMIPLV
jgi:hypothetical protein